MDAVHVDAAFAIGHRHLVCEDYAVAGADTNGAFAVVSDGCSSSPRTDVGARLLAHCAVQIRHEGDLHEICSRAALSGSAIGLPPSALDATLLLAQRNEDDVHIDVVGDGVVAAVDHDGVFSHWAVRQPGGAPAYLSYLSDRARWCAYMATSPRRVIERGMDGVVVDRWEESLHRSPWVWSLTLPANAYALVALLSDGAESFRSDDGDVPLGDVLPHLLSFKVLRGAFANRRLRRFRRRDCPRLGWWHDDDVAIAALAMERAR